MDAFSKYHPVVILCYYTAAVLLVIVWAHPVLSLIAWGITILTYGSLTGCSKCIRCFLVSLGAMILCLIINPLLNHRGVTLLFMAGELRITKEAVCYGGNMALMLLASLFLFVCFSHYMTSEKIMTLFSKRLPSFSLLFSMILRFVPKAGRDFKEMTALNGNGPTVWTALTSITLEDAVERSLSMKSRGYGKKTRTCFCQETLRERDVILFCLTILMGGIGLWYGIAGGKTVRFFPSMQIDVLPVWQWAAFTLYFSLPLILRGREEMAWYLSRRKITDLPIRNSRNRH